MSKFEKATYDRGFYNGIHEARQIFAKHLNVSASTDEIKWDNVSKTDILSEIDDFMMKNEEEQQAEKIKLESEINALEEVLEHGISTKFVEDEVIYVYSPKTAHEMREKLEENYKQLQPQLTIPKSIAEILGKYDEYSPTADELIMMAYRDYQEFHDWLKKEWLKNDNIAKAYLAGKALGVDLVKVGEG